MDWIALAKEGAGGGRGNGIKDVIDTVPRNVRCQSSNDALHHPRRIKTKHLKRSNAISGYIKTGEAILWTQSHKNIRKILCWQHSPPAQWQYESMDTILSQPNQPPVPTLLPNVRYNIIHIFKAHSYPCGQLVTTSLLVNLRPSNIKYPPQAAEDETLADRRAER